MSITEQDLIQKEQARQEHIKAAVKAAEDVLSALGDLSDDERCYLWYKTGATLMRTGLIEVDKRMLLADAGVLKLVKLEPEPMPKPEEALKCHCGRTLTLSVADVDYQTEIYVCVGCFNVPRTCSCKKLAGQPLSVAATST